MYVNLSDENVAKARGVIREAIQAGKDGTDTDLTSLGVLGEVLLILSQNDNDYGY